MTRPLSAGVRRCKGYGSEENGEWYWREGCEDCLRRTTPPAAPPIDDITPPVIIIFECDYRIEP